MSKNILNYIYLREQKEIAPSQKLTPQTPAMAGTKGYSQDSIQVCQAGGRS